MAFKSDKQRKAVMAKLNQGSVRSDVKPEIINNPSNKKAVKDDIRDSKYYKEMDNLGLRPEYRKSYIKDRKLGMTIAEANESLFLKIRATERRASEYRARQKLREAEAITAKEIKKWESGIILGTKQKVSNEKIRATERKKKRLYPP